VRRTQGCCPVEFPSIEAAPPPPSARKARRWYLCPGRNERKEGRKEGRTDARKGDSHSCKLVCQLGASTQAPVLPGAAAAWAPGWQKGSAPDDSEGGSQASRHRAESEAPRSSWDGRPIATKSVGISQGIPRISLAASPQQPPRPGATPLQILIKPGPRTEG
jgi:hypothetical protein